ncbi:aminopeptidase P family protein [Carboxylicivirga sp. M1479]|uniref:aminopeptidase P family protein n=1 Tax=Carboxylicivirga sp. M1479 TaxID=2594476 RepID=UPI001177C87B|nr:aminopeptidase P family protein [Carboxylicivirga sp. M1479]TRX72512.1 aminopeptidase P family protein [Carboxylicivirga sp. M1479]
MFSKETYINRRKRLQNKVESGLVLMLGNSDVPMNYKDNVYHFRQDSTFLYFFGIDLQDHAAIIDIDNNKEYLFGDDVSVGHIIWMGPQPTMVEKADRVGVEYTKPMAELSKMISDALKSGRPIHFNPPYRGENIMWLADLLGCHHGEVKDKTSLELTKACIEIRSIKEACEIEEMERHMAVAYKMHTTAMRMAQNGVSEQEITGAMEGISMSGGGMVSFPIICSKRGETLHNHDHSNILKTGDLLLVDGGSESPLHYATDHTRTSPVGGQFSQRQKEIYQIVVDANNISREATKPGITYKEAHLVAARVIASGLKDLGLMKGDVDEAVAAGAHAMFFPHGLGHMIGLDVHDMEDYNDTLVGYMDEMERSTQFGLAALRLGRTLQPNWVVTNEPGIYFIPALIDQWKADGTNADFINFDKVESYKDFGGVRLEDDILITDDSCRILGERIPITVDEVEATVSEGKK